MPKEVVAPATDEVVLDDETADAEFESGFDGTSTEVAPPAEVVEPVVDPAAAVVPEVKYRQITEAEYAALQSASTEIAQIKAEHRKELDRAFGKVGGVERTLAALQAATPSGVTVEVTEEDVADLKKEYPELGDLVLKSLKSMAGKYKGTAAAPAAVAIDPQQITTAAQQATINLQAEALEEAHPNWRATVGLPTDAGNPYRQWLATQSAEYQARLGSTNSAVIIGKSITKFQEAAAVANKAATDAAAAAKKLADAAAAKAAAASTRKQRLDAAVTQRGAGGHAPASSEDDDFEAGFKSG